MNRDPVAHVDRLLADGCISEAIAALERAVQAGHPDAMFRKAIWRLVGHPLSRDLPDARVLLRRATASGHADAALLEVALTSNGSGAPANWQQALVLLKNAAATHGEGAAAQLTLIESMTLTPNGHPGIEPKVVQIAEDPDIWHAAALFTPAECLHIAQSAADLLAPATVIDPRTGQNVPNVVRTSDGAVIGPMRETLVVQALNQRIATVSNTDVRQGEALAVLRYHQGQEFRPHLDAIAGTRNQRIKTVLAYLNDGFAGGATSFTHAGLRITPRVGDAIIFGNARADGTPDPRTQHAGEPVIRGTKWLATRWIRARPFDVWTGPEAA